MTPTELDVVRADTIKLEISAWFYDKSTDPNQPLLHDRIARAIRQADAAAGLVTVPREPPMTGNWIVDEIRKQNWPIMLAAAETNNES